MRKLLILAALALPAMAKKIKPRSGSGGRSSASASGDGRSSSGSGDVGLTEERKSSLIQEALHASMMNDVAAMHEWWCMGDDMDEEPLCVVWDLYHGDTTQYPKIAPKDRPSQYSVAKMHADYCRAPEHPAHQENSLCKEWEKNQQRAKGGGLDDATREVFEWWCADAVRGNTGLCTLWRRVLIDAAKATKAAEEAGSMGDGAGEGSSRGGGENGGDGGSGSSPASEAAITAAEEVQEIPAPSRKAIDKVHEHFCMVPAHFGKAACAHSPFVAAAREKEAKEAKEAQEAQKKERAKAKGKEKRHGHEGKEKKKRAPLPVLEEL